MVITNLAGQWKVARSVLVVHDESRDTMMLDLLTGSVALVDAANASGCIAIVIADSLLVSFIEIMVGLSDIQFHPVSVLEMLYLVAKKQMDAWHVCRSAFRGSW